MEPSGCILARRRDWRGVFDEDACGDVVLALALEEVECGLLVVVGLDCAEIPPPIGIEECGVLGH